MKPLSYTHWFVLLFFLIFSGCLSGQRPSVGLSPKLDKRLHQITPLLLTVGVYIEPDLRNYVQKESLRHYNIGVHTFIFPIGESLSSKIEEMSHIVFTKAVVIESLQSQGKEAFDGFLTVTLKKSEIELHIEESVWRAIGRHKLSLNASFLNSRPDKIWESEITAEGKGFDFISSKIEYEWWRESGPNFAPAVDDAIQKITCELAQKIITSKEIKDYAHGVTKQQSND